MFGTCHGAKSLFRLTAAIDEAAVVGHRNSGVAAGVGPAAGWQGPDRQQLQIAPDLLTTPSGRTSEKYGIKCDGRRRDRHFNRTIVRENVGNQYLNIVGRLCA